MMGLATTRSSEGDPMRLVLSAVLTVALGLWFLTVHRAGEISIHAGPRAARTSFVADRLTDPVQFNGALIFIAVLFLAALAAFASTLWDLVAAARSDKAFS